MSKGFDYFLTNGILLKFYEDVNHDLKSQNKTNKEEEQRIKKYLSKIRENVDQKTYLFNKYTLERRIKKSKDIEAKVRNIFKSSKEDKIVFKSLNEYLKDVYKEKLKNTGNILSIIFEIDREIQLRKLKGKYIIIKLDIKDFYPTMSPKIILKNLSNDYIDKRAYDLIKKAIFNVGKNFGLPNSKIIGVPQGIEISNILADIYLKDLKFPKKFGIWKNISFYRYVDDIIIFCDTSTTKTFLNKICLFFFKKNIEYKFSRLYRLKFNNKKSKFYEGYKEFSFSFLGYEFSFKNKEIEKNVKKDTLADRIKSFNDLYKFYDKEFKKFATFSKNFNSYSAEYFGREVSTPFLGKQRQKMCNRFIHQVNQKITGYIDENGEPKGWLPFYKNISNTSQLKTLDYVIKYNLLSSKTNIPESFKIELRKKMKSHVKAYFEYKKCNSKYIPNFQQILGDIDSMNKYLIEVLNENEEKTLLKSREEKEKLILNTMYYNYENLQDFDIDLRNLEKAKFIKGSDEMDERV